MSEKFMSGTINPKQTNKQLKQYRRIFITTVDLQKVLFFCKKKKWIQVITDNLF